MKIETYGDPANTTEREWSIIAGPVMNGLVPGVNRGERPRCRSLGICIMSSGSLDAIKILLLYALAQVRPRHQRATRDGEYPIIGYCAVCGYQMKGWRLIPGRKQSATIHTFKKFDVGR